MAQSMKVDVMLFNYLIQDSIPATVSSLQPEVKPVSPPRKLKEGNKSASSNPEDSLRISSTAKENFAYGHTLPNEALETAALAADENNSDRFTGDPAAARIFSMSLLASSTLIEPKDLTLLALNMCIEQIFRKRGRLKSGLQQLLAFVLSFCMPSSVGISLSCLND
ncbi:hypothetical protein HPP92_014106 [Vanilla planifolia]|uniref:Uncharacterized protein n=1 Tax=Vanilla planifolia TaxID=51239 RepID=A0A835UYM2_VANPL|nr:hypothetical protein HPP92_014106 [Vanilla planifolia]